MELPKQLCVLLEEVRKNAKLGRQKVPVRSNLLAYATGLIGKSWVDLPGLSPTLDAATGQAPPGSPAA